MVTFAVPGRNGYLGSVVARRWREHGARLVTDHADYLINCIRPDDLSLSIEWARRTRLIQPSTDAIFEAGDYAQGKRAVERLVPGVIIRAGIVDIRHRYAVAYTNWTCNPLTPLEWADLAWELRDHPGVHVAGRETLTRHDVARLVAREWGWDEPDPDGLHEPRNRVQPQDRPRPDLASALRDFHRWLG